MNNVHDIIVVGGGPADLAAAIHSAVFGLRTLLLEAGETAGGLATRARGISNYPGFLTKVSGLRLMEKMIRQTERSGVELHTAEEVVKLSQRGKNKVVETQRETYHCKALILATGDGMKGIGMKWETWLGSGVGYCAECGAPFFKGKNIIVVGNVNDAVGEALRLTEITKNVRLLNHANMININGQMRKQLKEKKVHLIEDFIGREIRGKPPFKRLVLQHVGGTSTKTLSADIVFVVGGVKPFVSVLRDTRHKNSQTRLHYCR